MSQTSIKWIIELVWLIFTVVLTAIILIPIYQYKIKFEWLEYNILYLIGSITLVRYIFTLHFHPLSNSKIFKVLAIFSVPLLFFPILEGLHSFIEFNDQVGLSTIMGHLNQRQQNWCAQYIRFEYILSGITCMLGVFALIVKMIRSLWRQYKFG